MGAELEYRHQKQRVSVEMSLIESYVQYMRGNAYSNIKPFDVYTTSKSCFQPKMPKTDKKPSC